MNILAISATPRKRGNSKILLERFLSFAPESASVEIFDAYKNTVKSCIACGVCLNTKCPIDDDMQAWYPIIGDADSIVVSHPLYFYGPPAPLKAFIDRCQPFWYRKFIKKEALKPKKAVLINVGAADFPNMFVPSYYIAKVWLNSLNASLQLHLKFASIENEASVLEREDVLRRVDEAAKQFFG
ncbi:NADPH-dependent FMN reductase [Thermosulfidibacter takaii ABI70S6]|uniref:NADPH-dependent FMN reductase n=1 Tax=Thermosulfidibacter takaii (strain DSM 17441 / JCM 13301 / NBRC 103674 / ABI70S6) TaxID=1298851 RepID=A0A0S3QUT3_THET7|nr:flavodoxin family protein [Thermosulfidibacter takaii]BAT72081.1 NADPH-dependent FMN reductase [Thermosulfidibacter takaii ABI70S6]